MDQLLEHFISALRGSGIRISISESTDAMRAVALMGYGDREVLKDALSVALAKSQTEKEIFEECFEQFFAFDAFSTREADSDAPLESDLDTQDSLLTQMLLSGDNAGLSVAMSNAARHVDITGIKFFTQKGLYIQKIMQQMGLEVLNRDIKRLRLEDMKERAKRLEATKEALFETVRNYVERQYDLFASSATEEMIEQYLRNIGLSNVEQRDFHRMRLIVQKMTKRLNTLYSRRRKKANRGLLDFKNTLRKNIIYGGLLFEPKWKKRKVDRPDVVAICDVSRSVKAVSRFLLLFLYSLNEILERIRTFIFCSNLIEVTHVFDEYAVEEA
ncbi:MAG: VWA domain-containing protein, partial [Deltaproteobacteria bacterium]